MKTQLRFKHLRITGGFLSGFEFDFSENLNCIIGARGAGKTTVLEFISYALNVLPLNTAAQKRLQSIVENNLEGGRIEVTVEAADGGTYLVSRKSGEQPQLSQITAFVWTLIWAVSPLICSYISSQALRATYL